MRKVLLPKLYFHLIYSIFLSLRTSNTPWVTLIPISQQIRSESIIPIKKKYYQYPLTNYKNIGVVCDIKRESIYLDLSCDVIKLIHIFSTLNILIVISLKPLIYTRHIYMPISIRQLSIGMSLRYLTVPKLLIDCLLTYLKLLNDL